MAEVLIISGAGDYGDAWHRFGDTSQRLAEIVASVGHQVTVTDAVEQALADPGEPDLIVVNIGKPREVRPQSRIDAVERGLDRHLQRGGALLGIHVSATSMITMSRWSQMLGGHWVPGRTMHPEQDLFTVLVQPGAHPIVGSMANFTVFDERYSYLHTNPDIRVVCEQFTDGRFHPIVWRARPDVLEWSTTAWATIPARTKARVMWTCFVAQWDGFCETVTLRLTTL